MIADGTAGEISRTVFQMQTHLRTAQIASVHCLYELRPSGIVSFQLVIALTEQTRGDLYPIG